MTETLAEKTCTPCRGGVPPLGRDEALRFQAQAPDWELRDEARRIERTFRFRNFREALAFVQQVGELAESEGHHPDISFGWGRATVSLSAKKVKGLHENDFIMEQEVPFPEPPGMALPTCPPNDTTVQHFPPKHRRMHFLRRFSALAASPLIPGQHSWSERHKASCSSRTTPVAKIQPVPIFPRRR